MKRVVHKRNLLNKKAQMQISFGMIFSIILIIFFLAFAFFGIRAFLGVQGSGETAKFLNDFQSDAEKVWKSAQSSENEEYTLPDERSFVCFVDFSSSARGAKNGIYNELKRAYYEKENIVFYPLEFEGTESAEIKYIDLTAITENENPFCIENINGKIKLRLTKGFGDNLVTIERAGG